MNQSDQIMVKFQKRNLIIFLCSIIFLGTFSGLFIYNWQIYQRNLSFQNCEEDWCLRIYGNVNTEVSIGLSYLTSESQDFNYYQDEPAHMLNSFETEYDTTYSGVSLQSIFQTLDLIPENATLIQFQSLDGFKSFMLPIELVMENPSKVLICDEQNGNTLRTKENGGEGPLKAYVALDILEGNNEVESIFEDMNKDFVYNSVYAVKYLSVIEVI